MNLAAQKPLLKYLICLLLAGVTFTAFAGLSHSSFITLDDSTYVAQNPHVQQSLSWNAIKWAFQSFRTGSWIPSTWMSYMVDWQFFGLNPAGYHITNLVLHVADTVLLFLLLEKLTARIWPSAFVALLFGIHPLHVESVAWVAERKDVLSTFFFLLTLLAYSRYTEKNHPQLIYYVLALIFFALGLMSKPMLVTLPFVLILLDLWPLNRFGLSATCRAEAERRRVNAHAGPKPDEGGATLLPRRSLANTGQRLIFEKLPFFILSAAGCYVTFRAQSGAGAVMAAVRYSFSERMTHVLTSYGWYILKFFWPVHLSIFYPLRPEAFSLTAALILFLLLAVTVLAIIAVRKHPYLLFGWFWFLGMLVPVIGFVQVGSQAYADRYTYLPYIGLFIIIAWGVPALLANTPLGRQGETILGQVRNSPRRSGAKAGQHWALWTAAAAIAIACFIGTVQETGYWKNGVALFGRAVALDPKDPVAWAFLGAEYSQKRDDSEAIECLNRSLALSSNSYLAWQWLGVTLAQEGDYARAEHAYRMALDTAVAMDENSVLTLNNLAWLLAAAPDPAIRNGPEAVTFAERACKLTHYQEAIVIGTLADAYAEAGRFDDAVAAAQQARDVAQANGQNDLAAENAQLMELYESHHTFHMDANPSKPKN